MNAVLLLAVTGLSLTLAGVMTAIAWRISRDERARSDIRVAALASAIYEEAGEERPVAARLFERTSTRAGTRYAGVAIVGACVVAATAGLTVFASRAPARAPVKPAAVDAPLELMSLEHERDGERLIVRGIIRNPATAAERDGLSATVLIFGQDGTLISTGRAQVPAARLNAGATTPFVVTIPDAGGVERFRISFRTDTRVEPHVDRRTS